MRIKSVNIKKQVRFGKDVLVFNIKQVNLYDFWINSKYDISKYLSHENTGYIFDQRSIPCISFFYEGGLNQIKIECRDFPP